jgi:hypothetical protein
MAQLRTAVESEERFPKAQVRTADVHHVSQKTAGTRFRGLTM